LGRFSYKERESEREHQRIKKTKRGGVGWGREDERLRVKVFTREEAFRSSFNSSSRFLMLMRMRMIVVVNEMITGMVEEHKHIVLTRMMMMMSSMDLDLNLEVND
jgi:hypothetical protein